MKKLLLLLFVPVILISGELKDALLQAKREHKPLMVYVKSNSCQFCDKMRNETLSDAAVQENMQGFIFVSTDKSGVEAQKYLPATRYTPTVYFISSKFHVVNTVKGYLAKDDFNLWINDTKSKLLMSSSVNVTPQPVVTESEQWMYDIASAKDYASQIGKQVMVYVDETNGKWSKKMKKETFSNDLVKEALEDFVWVKVQKGSTEATDNGLTPKYAPSVYFIRSDGSSLATAEGFFSPEDFLLWINYAKAKI